MPKPKKKADDEKVVEVFERALRAALATPKKKASAKRKAKRAKRAK